MLTVIRSCVVGGACLVGIALGAQRSEGWYIPLPPLYGTCGGVWLCQGHESSGCTYHFGSGRKCVLTTVESGCAQSASTSQGAPFPCSGIDVRGNPCSFTEIGCRDPE